MALLFESDHIFCLQKSLATGFQARSASNGKRVGYMSETKVSESVDTCTLPLLTQKLKKAYALSDLGWKFSCDMFNLALGCKQK